MCSFVSLGFFAFFGLMELVNYKEVSKNSPDNLNENFTHYDKLVTYSENSGRFTFGIIFLLITKYPAAEMRGVD